MSKIKSIIEDCKKDSTQQAWVCTGDPHWACTATYTPRKDETVYVGDFPPESPKSADPTSEPFSVDPADPSGLGKAFQVDLPSPTAIPSVVPQSGEKEMISHPDHYDEGDPIYEPYKVIQAWEANFNIGSALKYLARYKKKWNPIEDLKKAQQYIQFEIEHLEQKLIKK